MYQCDSVTEVAGCLGYRLPTGVEWEYAARAGTDLEFAGSFDPDEVAWYVANSGDVAHAVATKEANAWSLYDMSGNLYEFVSDWYNSSNVVVRSGCFLCQESQLTVGYSNDQMAKAGSHLTGFRLVRTDEGD